jgi:hypothetical protein
VTPGRAPGWHDARVKTRKQPASSTTRRAAKAPKRPAPAKPAAARSAPKKHGPRADLGQPIDGFFAKQPTHLRPITDALRAMIEAAAPDARSSLKWGMPCFSIGDTMMCAIGAHKAHVNLILSGPPGTFADPRGLLAGDGKTGRHLKLTKLAELPRAEVRRWLATAAARARSA